MANTTTTLGRSRRPMLNWTARRWITSLFIMFAAVAAFLIFDLIIGGKCDANCVIGTFNQAVRYATPIALAAYCGIMCERAAVINIGIEGMMLTSAMVAYAMNLVAFVTLKNAGLDTATAGSMSRLIGLLSAVLASGLLALLHAIVSIHFKADQIISGTVVNILAIGVSGYIYRQYLAEDIPAGPGTFPPFAIPVLDQIPVIGAIFFSGQKPLVYIMLVLTFLIHFVLFHTPWGLRTLAVGENPRAADTLGINVFYVRYVNVIIGGFIAGLGGAWFTLEAVDVFNPLMTSGLGFIGLAAMIFGNWTPIGALLGGLIFGLGNTMTTTLSIFRPDIPSQLPQMLPYLLTMIVLAGVVGRATAPAADGKPYEKQ